MEADIPGVNVNVEIPLEELDEVRREFPMMSMMKLLRGKVEMVIFKHPISDELYEEWWKQVFGVGGPGFSIFIGHQ